MNSMIRITQITRRLLALLAALVITACSPQFDSSGDISQGWEGLPWGTSKARVIEAISLEKADKAEFGNQLESIRSSLVRKVGGVKLNPRPLFKNNVLVGVYLVRTNPVNIDAEIEQIAQELSTRYGTPERNGNNLGWEYKGLEFTLSKGADNYALVIINEETLRSTHILSNDELQRNIKATGEKMGDASKLL